MDFRLLITEVKKRPALWDIGDPRHSNRDIVHTTWLEVAEIMQYDVDSLKKKWKSLRDNFRAEMKKVPPGKSEDYELPMTQYLSKWPYFQSLFFLRDVIVSRRTSGTLNKVATSMVSTETLTQAPESNTCPIAYPIQGPITYSVQGPPQIGAVVGAGIRYEEPFSNNVGVDCYENTRAKKRPCREQQEVENESLLKTERGKLLELLIQHNERRKKEENDGDRLFLLSLLPLMQRIPERKKLLVRNELQAVLQEVLYGSLEDCATTNAFRP